MNWEYSVFGLYAPGTLKSRAAQHKITTYDRRGRFVGVDPAGLESVVVIAILRHCAEQVTDRDIQQMKLEEDNRLVYLDTNLLDYINEQFL